MEQNIDIYLIGLSVLIFLIITFLFIRKISNSGELKVKIEPVTDSFEIKELDEIVQKINGNTVTIDQMVELFERGIFLNSHCKNILDTAKGKIYELVKDDELRYLRQQ